VRLFLFHISDTYMMLTRPSMHGLVCTSVYILSLIPLIPFTFSNVFSYQLKSQQKSVHGLAINEFPRYQVRFLMDVFRPSSHAES